MYTFGVGFLGSTETSNATDAHLRDYATRCKAVNWPARPVYAQIWSLAGSVRSQRSHTPDITVEVAKARHEEMGYRFFETKALATAAAMEFVARCEAIVTEVYGTTARLRSRRPSTPRARARGGTK